MGPRLPVPLGTAAADLGLLIPEIRAQASYYLPQSCNRTQLANWTLTSDETGHRSMAKAADKCRRGATELACIGLPR